MVDISKKNIIELSNKTNFIKDNIEKVLRLLDILELIYNSKWKDKLVLKGGTCINLIYRNIDRLSVDIDLDYIGNSKEEMLEDRNLIKSFFENVLFVRNYALSKKSKESYALHSLVFQYTNNAGNIDNIKIEINYLDRIHIFDINQKEINNKFYKSDIKINVLNEIELYATKINALINRAKARDLFDVNVFIKEKHIDNIDYLRKAIIFYNAISGELNLLKNNIFVGIDGITKSDMERQLKPMLTKDTKINVLEMKENVKKYINEILQLKKNEEIFIEQWNEKNFCPELLFNDNIQLKLHPMAEFRKINMMR